MNIPVSLIDPNPYQTREDYDNEIISGIAASALGRHGILQAPMLRPNNGRFETVFGHGRVRAAKAAGLKEIDCRVEEVTDAEMRRYMGQENVLRSDLSESERMAWLEQVRKDEGIELGETGFYAKMSDATGVSESNIKLAYYVKETRKRLHFVNADESKISVRLIDKTRGLESKDQDRLIVKALDKAWSSDAAFKVKTAVKDLDPEVRLKVLDKETDLTWKTIEALAKIDSPGNQLEAIDFILTRRLDEKTALQVIDDIINDVHPIYEVQVTDEYKQTYQKFQKTYKTVNAWGYNHYQIVKDHWDQIDPILTGIEQKIQEFRRYHRG